ncbi:MAG TPA: hypothetical protein PLP17_03465, partial [Oligoflexia bacterium]|nr:hypothetical protein [Oligoflexia bacterium]
MTKLILALSLIFLSGVVAGSAATGIFVQKRIEKIMHGGPASVRDIVVVRLARKLNLDAAQTKHVREIVTAAQRETLRMRLARQDELTRVVDQAALAIREILHPGQQEDF